MSRYIALTSKGLNQVLFEELKSLNLPDLEIRPGGASFEGGPEHCYRVNLLSRIATSVLMEVQTFRASTPEELYQGIGAHDYTQYIDKDQTLAVDAHVNDRVFKDSRYVGLKVKDALVDQFTEKFGSRPDVEKKFPDLKVVVRVLKGEVSVSLDTSGGTLSRRGYRIDGGDAPLREHLAAGLLAMTGWNGDVPLMDLMCGSGTILIEAALKRRQVAPGSLRQGFSFQKWKIFDSQLWDQEVDQALGEELPEPDFDSRLLKSADLEFEPDESVNDAETEAEAKTESPYEVSLFGYDIAGRQIKNSKANARRAGVEAEIAWRRSPVDMAELPQELSDEINGDRLGVVATNGLAPIGKMPADAHSAEKAETSKAALASVAKIKRLGKTGMIILNPPYGERWGEEESLVDVYKDLGFILRKNFSGWTCWVLSGTPDLVRHLKMKSSQSIQVFNGNINCRFLEYKIN